MLGFIGALLGQWVARALRLPEVFTVRVAGESFPVVWSVIGAALFVAILGLFAPRRSAWRSRSGAMPTQVRRPTRAPSRLKRI